MTAVFTLMVVFQFKHLIADYVLQAPAFFIGKFKADWGFVWPLTVHVLIHAAFTFSISIWFDAGFGKATALALFDASVHFAMDRAKASPRYLGRWKPLTGSEWTLARLEIGLPEAVEDLRAKARKRLLGNVLFWQILGVDQTVHHLTDITVMWFLIRP
jgi:hypothetical protein